ncbi:adenylosuccinate synthetase [Luedemannella helvata]|uniref:Adenylosuccinate synthetase n=1 Tax=Luedemannella helvata TaxID=349315 RepID=A0ABP4WCT3_9ACTN
MNTGHVAVVDLGFGDAGKGTVVDWLCATRPVPAVIRFNGGAQAGHNVVTADGRSHTFAQFGSGTLRGVPTFLSRFMVFDPLALTAEAEHLTALGVPDPYALLTVDRDALVATPYHQAVNRARELARGAARHGSCGMGVGETVAHSLDHPDAAIRAGDLFAPALLRRKLSALRSWADAASASLAAVDAPPVEACLEAYVAVAALLRLADGSDLDALLRAGGCVFEGAQGVLLDEWRGFHPYTTWSTTTFDNVAALTPDFYRLGVLRCFTTRHGAGPLVTEDAHLTATLVDPHNHTGPWQGAFRVGHFDAVAHRYAIEVCGGVDGLALSHVDVAEVTPGLRICRAYSDGVDRLVPGPHRDLDHQAALTARLAGAAPRLDAEAPTDWIAAVEGAAGAPVVLASHGPTAADKTVRRPVGLSA